MYKFFLWLMEVCFDSSQNRLANPRLYKNNRGD